MFLLMTAGMITFPVHAEQSAVAPMEVTSSDELAPPDPQYYSAVREIEGSINSVDVQAGLIELRDRLNRAFEIRVNAGTPVIDSSNRVLMLNDLRRNDRLHCFYTVWNRTARQIDRLDNLRTLIISR